MFAKDAHQGTRISFFNEIDNQTHTGTVGKTFGAFKGRQRVWYVDVALDAPNAKTGPSVALLEDKEVIPA